ncbi:MAG: hypothetical protein QF733_08360 [Phycisphaerales bacterium]|jgi:hypothetical protein|nr:hypothetical protein [Phycisphaerales bacterium]
MRSECALLTSVLCAAALSAGCGLSTRTTLDTPAAAAFPEADDSLDFWDALETQPVTTNDDALHGLLLLAGREPHADGWDARIQAAREAGWLTETPPPATESAQMGFIAVCVCHILDVQGGLSMRIFGLNSRYATRELVHMGLIPGITEHEALSGAEFIALLGAVEQRQAIDHAWAARAAQAAVPPAPPTDASPGTPAAPPSEPDSDQDERAGEGENNE